MTDTTTEQAPQNLADELTGLMELREQIEEHLALSEETLREKMQKEHPELFKASSLEALGNLCSNPPEYLDEQQVKLYTLFANFACDFNHFFRDVRHQRFNPVEETNPDFPPDLWVWVLQRVDPECSWLTPDRLFYICFPMMTERRRHQGGSIYDRERFQCNGFSGTYDRGANDRPQVTNRHTSERWTDPQGNTHCLEWCHRQPQGSVTEEPNADYLGCCGLEHDSDYTLMGEVAENFAYVLEFERIRRSTSTQHSSIVLDDIYKTLTHRIVEASEVTFDKHRDTVTHRPFYEATQKWRKRTVNRKQTPQPPSVWCFNTHRTSWVFRFNSCYYRRHNRYGLFSRGLDRRSSGREDNQPQSEWFPVHQALMIASRFSMDDTELLSFAFLPFINGTPGEVLGVFNESEQRRLWISGRSDISSVEGTTIGNNGDEISFVETARHQDLLAARVEDDLSSLEDLSSLPLASPRNSLPALLDSILYEDARRKGNNNRGRIDEEILNYLYYWSIQPDQQNLGMCPCGTSNYNTCSRDRGYYTVFSAYINKDNEFSEYSSHTTQVARFIIGMMTLIMGAQQGRTNPLLMILLYANLWIEENDTSISELIHELCYIPYPRLGMLGRSNQRDLNVGSRLNIFAETYLDPERLDDHPFYLAAGLAMIALYKRTSFTRERGSGLSAERVYLWNEVWSGSCFGTLDDVIKYWLSHAELVLPRSPASVRDAWTDDECQQLFGLAARYEEHMQELAARREREAAE